MATRTEIVDWLDTRFEVQVYPDFSGAQNGLQLEGKQNVETIAWAVDACKDTIEEAVSQGVDFLLVHHGLLWGPNRPFTGARYQMLRAAIERGLNLYSLHLPLDGDLEFGNAAIIAKSLGLQGIEAFGDYKGRPVGVGGTFDGNLEELRNEGSKLLGSNIRGWFKGENKGGSCKLAIATGSAADYLELAAESGYDALLTGEASHHRLVDARDMGFELWLGGHYETEIFGIKSMVSVLSHMFDLKEKKVGSSPLTCL